MAKRIVLFLALCCSVVIFATSSDLSRFKTAGAFIKEENYVAAVSCLEDERTERNFRYYGLHGVCCAKLPIPRYRDAIQDFETLLGMGFENNYNVFCELTQWSYFIAEFEKAIEYGRRASPFPHQTYSSLVTCIMAESYYKLGRYAESLEMFELFVKSGDALLPAFIDYNKVRSIVNDDNSLEEFWDSLGFDNLSETEKDDLIIDYAKALMELGKFDKARKQLEKVPNTSNKRFLANAYSSFLTFILSGDCSSAERLLYLNYVEETIKGRFIISNLPPDVELLKLSTLYFYFRRDYKRAGIYCSWLIRYANDIRGQAVSCNKADIECYFANDRLYLIALNMKKE